MAFAPIFYSYRDYYSEEEYIYVDDYVDDTVVPEPELDPTPTP